MNIKSVLYITGLFLLVLGLLMALPTIAAVYLKDGDAWMFLVSATITSFVGLFLINTMKTKTIALLPRHIFLLTNITWILISIFSSLPFLLVAKMSWTDSFFESMSGITTTGATVIDHLSTVNGGILLWRSILQWIGGIGFIVLAVAILPFLKVGGMRLFQSESSDWSDKCLPRSGSIAKHIVTIYFVLTIACTFTYYLAGMGMFDAINHAMTTVSTGGYSTSDYSLGNFNSLLIYWNTIIFMILGSLPFVSMVKLLRGSRTNIFKDSQIRCFMVTLLIAWIFVTIWLWQHSSYNWFEAFTYAAFNTTSIITSTGYAVTDYTLWGGLAVSLFFFLAFVGGCSGSTTGGVKIFRFQIGFRLLNIQLKHLAHPRAFQVQSYNGIEISNEILRSLVAFCFFFGLLIAIITTSLSFLGLDLITSLSGAVSIVTNVGPALGDIVGPAGNYSTLPSEAKWILCTGMLVGRLEIITVIIMLIPDFWRT